MLTHAESLVAHRWPRLWSVIQDAALPVGIQRIDNTPNPSALISGLTLASAFNRTAEARLQAASIPENSPSSFVYGLGLGDLPRVLLERPALERLVVTLLNPGVARWVFKNFNQGDWMGDPRVELVLADQESQLQRPFASNPACTRLAVQEAFGLRDQVMAAINEQYLAQYFKGMEGVLEQRLEQALPRIAQDGDVSQLFGAAAGRPVVVVAGGPTADNQFEWIRAKRQEIIIVAVSTALHPLQRAGIVADVAVIFDPQPRMIKHLAGLKRGSCKQTPLVYLPTVHPEVLDAWSGPRLAAYQDIPRFRRIHRKLPRGYLFCSGTVTHAAVDLAVQMGADPIVLVGADFSNPFGKSHASGATLTTDASTEGHRQPHVVNGQGSTVPSTLSLISYLRDLETYIQRRPGTRFFNTGREGAEIQGAPWLKVAA